LLRKRRIFYIATAGVILAVFLASLVAPLLTQKHEEAPDLMMLVNGAHTLPREYVPGLLVTLPGGHRLTKEAAEACAALL